MSYHEVEVLKLLALILVMGLVFAGMIKLQEYLDKNGKGGDE